jgi:hypothetical protein
VDVEESIDALYRNPPRDFVEAREALVAELKAARERDAAAEVHGLRRPTVVAWAVNQVAHDDADGIATLLDATAQLGAAHGAARPDSAAIRDATGARRDVLSRLADQATARLADIGSSVAKADEAERLLDAASLDPEASQLLVRGRLTSRPERPSGFDAILGSTSEEVVVERAAAEQEREDRAAAERTVARAREQFDAREADSEAAADAVRRLEGELERARRRAEKAARAADDARRAVADAEEALNRTFDEPT